MIATSLWFQIYDGTKPSDRSGGTSVTTTTTANTYSDSSSIYTCVFYDDEDWTPTYYPEYKDEFTPAHKVKNPFEYQIFQFISNRHGSFKMPKHKNITFKRQGFKGFIC